MSGRRRRKRHVGPDKLHHLTHGHDLSPHQNTYAPRYGITGYFLRSSDDIYRPYALPGQPSSSSPYMPIHYHIDGIHRILCFLFAPVSVLVLSVPHVPVVPKPMMPTSQPSTSHLFSSSVSLHGYKFQIARSPIAVYTTNSPWAILSVSSQPQASPKVSQKNPKNPSYLTLHWSFAFNPVPSINRQSL